MYRFFFHAEKDNERSQILKLLIIKSLLQWAVFFKVTYHRAPSPTTLPSHFTKCFIVGAKQLKVINNFKTQ